MTIRFENIRTYQGSQNNGFEELVCQIARRHGPVNADQYVRIEGAGGDGGVEAYWTKTDGGKIGYQAKYFLASKFVDWAQIDKSVKTAINVHPDLTEYVVAIPCDLTGKTGNKGRGKSGLEHWETHKKKWEGWATKSSMTINFVCWSASEIVDRLTNPSMAGVVLFWFDTVRFTNDWFSMRFEETVANLDERYHPEDHVVVGLSRVFEGLTRSAIFAHNVRTNLDAVKSPKELHRDHPREHVTISDEVWRELSQAYSNLSQIVEGLELPHWHKIDVTRWRDLTLTYQNQLKALMEVVRDVDLSSIPDQDRRAAGNQIRNYEITISNVCSTADHFVRVLDDIDVQADQELIALIYGEPGSGKSHLLADAMSRHLSEGGAGIFLLGQQFPNADPLETILTCLGVDGPPDALLQALDVAAEARRGRCLIAIDALNEAPDLKVWGTHLAGFVTRLSRFRNLTFVLTCRPEYRDFLIPNTVREKMVEAECFGFVTREEREAAAKQYLDKRGIVRPATPWLAPEFTNPLFLRTCSLALQEQGMSEFPRGMRGSTAVLKFYVESLGKRLSRLFPGASFSTGIVSQILQSLARDMHNNNRDYLPTTVVGRLILDTIGSIGPGGAQTWVDVFRAEGIIRRDHLPGDAETLTLDTLQEVYRFSFQRFSDHLIVAFALEGVTDPQAAFSEGGGLSFLFSTDGFDFRWSNLLTPLSIQLPEKFSGVELIDIFPSPRDRAPLYSVQNAYWDSLIWRSGDAVTDRTIELFNSLAQELNDPRLGTLLRLAVVQDHPMNIDFVSKALLKRSMAERDAFWSVEISEASGDDDMFAASPISEILDWSLNSDKRHASDETLRLAATCLAWLFTSTARPTRDRATKALTVVLLERPQITVSVLDVFKAIDDLYVLERLYAAVFGAACVGLPEPMLAEISARVYAHVFEDREPPLNILLRDYALGTIERADSLGCLPHTVDLSRCKPPYTSSWPLEDHDEADIKALSESVGDDSIYMSCLSWGGDFGTYEIEPHLRTFSSIPLTDPAPLSADQKFAEFRKLINETSAEYVSAFIELEAAVDAYRESGVFSVDYENGVPFSTTYTEEATNRLTDAEAAWIACIDNKTLGDYRMMAEPILFPGRGERGHQHVPEFDVAFGKRWITHRALSFGWTKELFPYDRSRGMSRQRAEIERTGKKYQWLALSELMARLSDNVWIRKGWDDDAETYSHIGQHDFMRDIEPTILDERIKSLGELPPSSAWWLPRQVEFTEQSDAAVAQWPFFEKNMRNGPYMFDLNAPDGSRWLALRSLVHKDERYNMGLAAYPFRRSMFVRVSTLIMKTADAEKFCNDIHGTILTDPADWEHVDATDGPYYLEFDWRQTWDGYFDDWNKDNLPRLEAPPYVRPVVSHVWERHLDASLPNGATTAMPSPWLAKSMGLRPTALKYGEFVDQSGQVVFIDPASGTEQSSAALIERKRFFSFLKDNGLDCVWVVAGELDGAPTPDDRGPFGRRTHTGVYRYVKGKWTGDVWWRDHCRNLTSYDPKLVDKLDPYGE